MERRSYALPRSSTSNSWSERSHCGPTKALSKTSEPDLITRVAGEAPGVRLRFVQNPNKDSGPLRDGTVGLETGVMGKTTGPEVRAQAMFRDRFIGVVRLGHSLSQDKITPSRYAAGRHICVLRRGLDKGPIDEALNLLGLEREIVTIVGGFSTALG
jgi:hypothetical protein